MALLKSTGADLYSMAVNGLTEQALSRVLSTLEEVSEPRV